MKKTTRIALIFTLFCSTLATAQDPFYYDDTEKEYKINKKTSPKILDKYLKKYDLKAIAFNPDTNSIYSFRVQYKSGDWALVDSWNWEVYRKKGYSLMFPGTELGAVGFTTAIYKKEKYLYSLGGEESTSFSFDEMSLHQIVDTTYYFNVSNQESKEELEMHLCLALKSKGKWGMIHIARDSYTSRVSGDLYQLTPFNYTNEDDLPIASISHIIRGANDLVSKGLLDEKEVLFSGIDRIASDNNYTQVKFNSDLYSHFPLKVRHKKGHWGLATISGNFIGWNNVSIDFPNELGFSIATEKDKKYALLVDEDHGEYILNRSLGFDELIIRHRLDTAEVQYYDEVQDQMIWKKEVSKLYDGLAIRKGNKFALAHFDDRNIHLLSGFYSSSAKELPDSLLTYYNDYEYEFPRLRRYDQMMAVSNFLKENKAFDIAYPFKYGKYSYSENDRRNILLIRHAETKRWSMQILGGYRSETDIPIAASSIVPHSHGDEVVLETWCDNKVGYYCYDGNDIKEIIACQYDDFELVHLDYTIGCAVKKNGFWELYHIDSKKKHVEGKAKTIEELKELWWNR